MFAGHDGWSAAAGKVSEYGGISLWRAVPATSSSYGQPCVTSRGEEFGPAPCTSEADTLFLGGLTPLARPCRLIRLVPTYAHLVTELKSVIGVQFKSAAGEGSLEPTA